ncbi:ABC transporter substrate-binding protein [Paucibacter sp. AS339]|uniref:ABC transporter substrate-binding protein n=1 Tax=Paucibacter hankyongi TaxID=3133434 RepID=UPI003099DDDE
MDFSVNGHSDARDAAEAWRSQRSLGPHARRGQRILLVLLMLTGACALSPAMADNYFDRYGLQPASPELDLGAQPLGYPSGVISAVIQRDSILRRALAEIRQPLKVHPFRRGADMIGLLGEQRLEAGLLGDMPTLLAAAAGQVLIVGLVKQTSTAIVAKGDVQVGDLAGKRIGYVEGSSAHLTLLQGLASAGIQETQVKMVPVGVVDMPQALERGDIDAFAAWEPAPTLALARSDKNHIVFRSQSSDYFVIERRFEQRSPQAASLLVAAYLRALEWMRMSSANLERAARWAMADTQTFDGKASGLTAAQIATITRREILNVPSAPHILVHAEAPPLQQEFQFLRKLGKLPPSSTWAQVETAFRYDGLARVQGMARAYQLRSYDYSD